MIYQYDGNTLVGTFSSLTEAADFTGIDITNISRAANGQRNSAGGFTWTKKVKASKLEDLSREELLAMVKGLSEGVQEQELEDAPSPYEGGNPNNVLVIGDTHEPFSREGYLEFCREVQEKFDCGTVVHIGDEVDNHAISYHETDPDGDSAGTEADKAQQKMNRWYETFPDVKVCVGNHSALPFRQAMTVGLPKRFLKAYEEVWNAPPGWKWDMEWEIDGVLYTHGTGTSGQNAAFNKAMNRRQSVVQGHLHSDASIKWNVSSNDRIFAMQVGCGVDDSAYAMAYAKSWPKKYIISCGVVLNGELPIVVPMNL